MKYLIIALTITLSNLAMASEFSRFEQDEPAVEYRSWCEDNKVMTSNAHGKLIEWQDCQQDKLECKSFTRRIRTALIYTAACVPQK